MKFEHLPLASKIIVIEQFGERIGRLEEDGQRTDLYLLNDFYVEVFYKEPGIIVRIEKVLGTKRLDRYCPELDW